MVATRHAGVAMVDTPNVCAGPFGAFYDFYIERPWLMGLIGRVVWGIDASVLYASIEQVRGVPDGTTIIDAPCGGGVALRAFGPGQDVRYIAVDLSERMLARAGRRAAGRGLRGVELVSADMCALPFPDAQADVFLSYSGLHMVDDPQAAIAEIARCLKPGGRLLGSTFLAGGSRRSRMAFALGARRGHPTPPRREDLLGWLVGAGFVETRVGVEASFVAFEGRLGVGMAA